MCYGAIFFSAKAVAETFLAHYSDGREQTLLCWAAHLEHCSVSTVCFVVGLPLNGEPSAHEGVDVLQVANWSEIRP